MDFYLSDSTRIPAIKCNIIVLYHVMWDDWFAYNTLYKVYYYNNDQDELDLGSIKLGQKNMSSEQRIPDLPDSFNYLGPAFFSVGQDVSYYETLNTYGDEFRDNVLTALCDMSFNSSIYDDAMHERVTRISLLRSVSTTSIKGQYRRLAQGDATLTPYDFQYHTNKHSSSDRKMILDFKVDPESNPPTNVHVVIGRNGVGKTYLFNNMINSLLDEASSKNGVFTQDNNNERVFANLVYVSFSAFDETNPMIEKRDKIKNLNYSYIGLKKVIKDNIKLSPKSPTILKNEFVKSLEMCRLTSKTRRWIDAIKILENDPLFKESEISKVVDISQLEEFKDKAGSIFHRLSSGHKIVLMSITKLVETIEERSLVLLDEPEAYLHPPLLSAFIRALSNLLTTRNAVAIIGTHSPVVLQEVPKSCVWKLRRHGFSSIAERLEIESFGENIGILTQEVFGLEIESSGYHKILQNLNSESDSYNEAITTLNNQLGMEGKVVLRNLFHNEEH